MSPSCGCRGRGRARRLAPPRRAARDDPRARARCGRAPSTEGAVEALAALAALPPTEAEPGPATWETTNLLHLGQALSLVAHLREETRGGHVRSDFPERDDAHWLRHLTTTRSADGALVVTERPVEDPA